MSRSSSADGAVSVVSPRADWIRVIEALNDPAPDADWAEGIIEALKPVFPGALLVAGYAVTYGPDQDVLDIPLAAPYALRPMLEEVNRTVAALDDRPVTLSRHDLDNAQIAALRSRSVRTIATQVAAILRKTNLSSRSELVVRVAGGRNLAASGSAR